MEADPKPKVVFDEVKRIRNLDTHGMDFLDVKFQFFGDALIVPARKNRLKAIGRFRSGMIAVIFVELGKEAVSAISMRSASRAERRVRCLRSQTATR